MQDLYFRAGGGIPLPIEYFRLHYFVLFITSAGERTAKIGTLEQPDMFIKYKCAVAPVAGGFFEDGCFGKGVE